MMIYACAPCRILDIGSWTDTAFAEHGAVMNCAVGAYVRVVAQPSSNPDGAVRLRKEFSLAGEPGTCPADYHFLRTAARHFDVRGVEIAVSSDLAPGHGFGVSAAAAVALTAALAAWAGRTYTPHQLGALAHQLDAEVLGRACGVESYLASALGGVGLYHVAPYPRAIPVPITMPEAAVNALESRLTVVRVGRTLPSNTYHALAQRRLQGDAQLREVIWQLRLLAPHAIEAICRREFATLGALMIEQARLQSTIFPIMRSGETEQAEAIAGRHGATALKANGSGGSLTVLCPPGRKAALEEDFRQADFPVMPVRIDPWGVRVRTYDLDAPRLRMPEFDIETA